MVGAGFEGEAYANYFEGVSEEDADHAGHAATDESSAWGLLSPVFDHSCADLFVGEEFDSRVWEDAEEGCAVAFEEPAYAICGVDVVHGCGEASP